MQTKALSAIAVVSLLTAFAEPASACDQSRTGPIADVHLHFYPSQSRMLSGLTDPVTGKRERALDETGHRNATLKEMKRCGVVRGIASSEDLEVAHRTSATPGLFPALQVGIPTAADLDLIRRMRAEGRLFMIGEVISQYEGVRPDDPRMEPLWALAEELDIPVGLHIGPGGEGVAYKRAPAYRVSDSNPFYLEPVLLRHPKLRIFVMHAAWPMADEIIGMLYAHPQLYVDISVINWIVPRAEFHGYLKRLTDAGFGKRILFGSDHMVWTGQLQTAVEAIESATFLSAGQKRDIFYNNAMKFFRWSD